ncbi:cytochrome P450 [Sphingomonas sp.]|uniref:cytochrome P450 n=1 Tax=Sphingomonas sp. TaxID=28214 RepID=UPI00286ADEDC|nr:cytochrome P450 [Sphingomonas sp.]
MNATYPERFVPPYPPRGDGPVAVWRGFFGERARTAVYGWSQAAFELDYMQRRVMGYNVHIPLTPDAVQQILLDQAAGYEKPTIVKSLLAPVIGRGLLTSDGQLWREQRRIVAASFVPPAVDALIPVFADAARAVMARWQAGTLDMAVQSTATTMRIIADSLFGGDPRLTSNAASDHITAALEAFGGRRIQALLGLPALTLTPKARAGLRGQTYLRRSLAEVVGDRFRVGQEGEDFLGQLVAALRQKFDRAEAEALAIDNAATFYLAGHETTANAMTWALFLLSEQPQLQQRIAAEARVALAVDDRDPKLPDRLPLLRQAFDETLRLYPSAPRLDRQAIAPGEIAGRKVAPGDIVSIWPWIIHRHTKLWDDPDAFDIDRFAPGRKGERHRFQYLPFGGGVRVCVGARFATSEALTILAHWLAAWEFRPVPGRIVRASGMVTLRPAGGLKLAIRKRYCE